MACFHHGLFLLASIIFTAGNGCGGLSADTCQHYGNDCSSGLFACYWVNFAWLLQLDESRDALLDEFSDFDNCRRRPELTWFCRRSVFGPELFYIALLVLWGASA